MCFKAGTFCTLALLLGTFFTPPAYADLDINPVPFNAEKFAEQISSHVNKSPEINIKTLNELEPSSGITKSPEPEYMITIQPSAPNVAKTITQTTLQNGQKVRITIENEPELSSIYTINSAGQIDFPLIGKIKASQTTPASLQETLKARLKDGYLINPIVKAEAITADPIFVLGNVIAPGKPIYAENISIASAILRAGGYENSTNSNQFEILRTKTNDPGLISATQDEEKLIPGDVLIVKGY